MNTTTSPESTVQSPRSPKFSPAPWQLNKDDLTVRSINDDLVHVHAFAEGDAKDEANAKLIAAAPELFGAVEFVLSHLAPADAKPGEQCKLYSDCLHPTDDDKTVVDYLRDVIHKTAAPETSARMIPADSELAPVSYVSAFEVWVRLKKNLKIFFARAARRWQSRFFQTEWVSAAIGHGPHE